MEQTLDVVNPAQPVKHNGKCRIVRFREIVRIAENAAFSYGIGTENAYI